MLGWWLIGSSPYSWGIGPVFESDLSFIDRETLHGQSITSNTSFILGLRQNRGKQVCWGRAEEGGGQEAQVHQQPPQVGRDQKKGVRATHWAKGSSHRPDTKNNETSLIRMGLCVIFAFGMMYIERWRYRVYFNKYFFLWKQVSWRFLLCAPL